MEAQQKLGEGICILSLDGGGSGSISQLCMIDEIMERLASDLDIEEDTIRPADRFDLIGGVGVGGFVALLLGRLGMTAKQAKDQLSRVGSAVFTKGYEMESPEANKKRLQEAIETMLRECGHETDINLRDDSARCKVVVFAASPNVVNLCQPLRTYRHRGARLDCTFVQAACALMAVPGLFSPSCIGPTSREQRFIGIPRGRYNPTRVVFREARNAFSDKTPVSLALSLGSGQEAAFTEVDCHATRWSHIHCDVASNDLSHQLSGVAAYLRLNVDSGIEDIHVDNWQQLGLIETRTTGYLEMDGITRYIDEACQWLINRNGSATLGQINGTSSEVPVRSHSQRLEDLLERRFKEMENIMQDLGIEKITLVDAIGNDIDIPKHFCPTYPMLLEVIGIYFKYQRPPGTDLVERGDYRLVHGSRKSILGPVEWNQIEKARLKVEMSMVLRRRNDDKTRCPQCRTPSLSTDGWVTCLACSAQFQSEDRVEEEVGPGGYSRHKDERANQSGILNPGVSTGGVSQSSGQGDSLVTETRKNAKEGQAQFRLISVINLLHNAANEARAFAEINNSLKKIWTGQREPSIMIGISTIGSESWEIVPHLIPTSTTFADMAAESTSEGLLDFWSEETNCIRNRVTPSGMWFKWQHPTRKVVDAVTEEGHVRIVTVYSLGEYIVALVKDGEREYGMPIELPRTRSLPASEHLQKIFPDRIISQIRHLETGADASNVVFDIRSFAHNTASLFIELSAKRALEYVPSDSGEEGGSGEGGGFDHFK